MQFPLLSVIIFIPLLAGLAILFFPADRRDWIRFTALGAAILTILFSFIVYLSYDPIAAGYQFRETLPWVPALGISYQMGVDGISVPLVLWRFDFVES
jgi:NADH-quinone oxidoreductase subunit M